MDKIPTVTFGETQIEYLIRRSDQRATADVAIDPKEGVIVTCPSGLPESQIEEIIVKKAPWILRKLKRVEEVVAEPPKREYVSGETYYYLGRGYRLKVIKDPSLIPFTIKLKQGRFEVRVPEVLGEDARRLRVRDALQWWFKEKAKSKLHERIKLYERKVGNKPNEIVVKNQMKRWGSCTKDGRVSLNYRIIMAPMSIVDYVVTHELVHLTIDDHSKEFWDRLRVVIPDYMRRKELLRINGPTLII